MVISTSGFYIDVTETSQADVTSGVSQAAASRAGIEQAKGVLRLPSITAHRAFDILVWRSQETNIEVRESAHRFLAAMTASIPPDTRTRVDHIQLRIE